MEIIIVVSMLLIAAWFWRARQYDKQTLLDFDSWVSKYENAASPLQASRMAVALLSQSIHFAWERGAINSKQRDSVTAALKQMRATTVITMWLGSSLPSVLRVIPHEKICSTPARGVGVFLLLAWMAPEGEAENAIHAFLFPR